MDDENNGNSILDLRKVICWNNYTNPKSDTFGKSKESALKAGYTASYSTHVTSQSWFKDKLLKLNLLPKAEKALNKALDIDTKNSNGQEQADLLRVQTDVAKFIAKTLGKDEGYSERTELTGKDGGDIVFMPAELIEKYDLSKKVDSDKK